MQHGGDGEMRRLPTLLSVCLIALCCSLAAAAGNYHDGGIRDEDRRLLGARASITTAPIPDLHWGEFSCVWAMVNTWPLQVPQIYAQAGYMFHEDETTLKVFAEWTDEDGMWTRKWGPVPGSGDHTYECRQNPNTGLWTFKYDGVKFADSGGYDTSWFGNAVQFMGEVYDNIFVQMMGDNAHRVKFSDLEEYWAGCPGSWRAAWPEVWLNDYALNWGQYKSQPGGCFRIWDCTP